jgi:DNA polymerase III subunit gamma/tau
VTAIYQRSRPIQWDEVVGQEHVKEVLRPALERGRIGHAYLFSGPRGVGKTTTARLIAMTVNCEVAGVKPCGQCDSCKTVISGRHPDVLEIDAASNNSVDDVRDLREKVALQPMRGDKKVYILDEAHMMSKSAFNALLKTLEEPPAHAVFVLATTEPERLPPTILSRCQHYRFRRLSAEEIAGKLLKTCGQEGVTAAPQALDLIARAADGAMRDGESLLERLLAAGEPMLTLEMVEGALGLPPQERVNTLALALARGETGRVLSALGAFYSDGFAPRTITERVKVALRDLLHMQLGLTRGGSESFAEAQLLRLIRALDEEDARFARASDLIALEMAFTKAMLSLEIGEGGGAASPMLEARLSNLEKQVRGAFQKVVDEGLRASGQKPTSNLPDFDPVSRPIRKPSLAPITADDDDAPFETPPTRAEPEMPRAESRDQEAQTQPRSAPIPTNSIPAKPPSNGKGWGDIVIKAKPQFKAFLREAKATVQTDAVFVEYGPKHKWHAEQVASKFDELLGLIHTVLGEHYRLELVMPDGATKSSVPPSVAPPAAQPLPPQSTARAVPTAIEELKQARAPEIPPPLIPDELATETAVVESTFVPNPSEALFASTIIEEVTPATEALHAPLEPSLNSPTEQAVQQITSHEQKIFDDAPGVEEMPLPTEGGSLETFDLESLDNAPPITAFDMDFGDLERAVPAKPNVAAKLAGHPNYTLLSKLFTHRVREAGKLEVNQVEADKQEIAIAPTADETTGFSAADAE